MLGKDTAFNFSESVHCYSDRADHPACLITGRDAHFEIITAHESA